MLRVHGCRLAEEGECRLFGFTEECGQREKSVAHHLSLNVVEAGVEGFVHALCIFRMGNGLQGSDEGKFAIQQIPFHLRHRCEVERRAALHELRKRVLDNALGHGIESARRLVEDEDRRVSQYRACDADSLALAAGKRETLLADHALVPLGLRHDEIVGVRQLRCGHDLVVRRVWRAVADVLLDRVVEENRLLRDCADERAEVRYLDVAQVHTIHRDAPLGRVEEPCKKVRERRLAAASAADHRDNLAARDLERSVRHGVCLGSAVAERDVLKRHLAIERLL